MATRLTNNRHPLLIDHATQAVVDLTPGETLHAFLYRHIENLDSHKVVVQIGGVDIPAQHWTRLRPKDGQHIVVRSTVHKSALLIVALVALTIFTAGAAAAIAGAAVGGGALGAVGGAVGSALLGSMGATAASIAVGAMQVIGALVINKVLGPKAASPTSIDRDEVYTLSAASNSARQYEPFGILFGEVKVTPDYLSLPYYSYKNNDQYMSFIMTPGLNVASYGDLYFGDTLLSTYQEVTVWKSGFSGMSDDTIPISTNVDTVSGATLDADVAVVRTTPTETTRIQVDITYLLFDLTSKGKKKNNQENVVIAISPVTGTSGTTTSRNVYIVSQEQTEQRRSYTFDVIEGQYDVTVTRQGNDTDGSGATCEFTWATLTAYQKDETDYTDIPRIAIEIKASGQINGTPDQINATMVAEPIPYWNGTAWTTATDRASGLSNPGANILKYLRGYYDSNGVLMAGMGLSDDMIDIESFKGFMVHCFEWELYYDAYIQSDRNHEEALSAMALAGMGYVDFSPGRATAIWCSDQQGVEGVVSMANMKKTSFQLNYTLATAADGIEYSYFDRESWDTKTLYVAAPGVDNPVNYAQVSGEGVTTEAHAAIMARYHMAQMLYQFKDINFGTDLEHLVYHRLSMIQLSHDLTQWGYSGRLKSITLDGSRHAALVLDEEVPASIETAYIGLRLPTETGYRVYQVETRLTTTNTIELVGALPTDFVIPEKAHDIIWIFDFKTTPGLRCRVISIAPEDDLNGAVIGVVPEGDEFWNYVKTGEYIPPSNESLLDTRPRVSNLRVGEQQVVQGDTVFTELWATWDVSGPSRRCVVYCTPEGGDLATVAETDGRSAKWRIDGSGTYVVGVRAFNYDDWPSTLVQVSYTTVGADSTPVLVDTFDVENGTGGVRKYTWGFYETTIQSADFAGVEVRYINAEVAVPTWETMTPVGDTGFHTSAFESPIPASGDWTFACRSVNTSGVLSDEARWVTKTLDKNLEEIQEDQQNQLDTNSQQIIDNFNQLYDEQQALVAELAAQAAELANLQAALDAQDWDSGTAYTEGTLVKNGGHIYVALQNVPAGTALSDTAYWEDIGEYASLAAAVAATSIAVQQLQTSVTAIEGEVDTLSTSVTGLQSSVAGKADASTVTALASRVTVNEANIAANSSAITSINSSLSGKADASALTALTTRVTTVEGAVSSNASAITSVSSRVGSRPNMLTNGDFSYGTLGVNGLPANAAVETAEWGKALTFTGANPSSSGNVYSDPVPAIAGVEYTLSADMRIIASSGQVVLDMIFYNASGTTISVVSGITRNASFDFSVNDTVNRIPMAASAVSPTGTASIRWRFRWINVISNTVTSIRYIKLERGAAPPTPYTGETGFSNQVSAVQSLTTRVTATEAGVTSYYAAWQVTLDANGYVSGVQSVNNGSVATFSILADRFAIVSPAGGARTEYSNGNWRVYDASNVLRVAMGINI